MEPLEIYDWQYAIKLTSTTFFNGGDEVFLKSNPECTMHVYMTTEKLVIVGWLDKNNELQFDSFPPEYLLHYIFAGLVFWKRKYLLSLN